MTIRVVARQANIERLDELTALINSALQTLVNEHNIILNVFSDDVRSVLKKHQKKDRFIHREKNRTLAEINKKA